MKNGTKQKEMMLAEQFKARSAPAIPDGWQKSLMDAVRSERALARIPAIIEDDRFIFRFAAASALSAAAALLIFVSIYFYVDQASAKSQDASIFYGGIENIVDTI